MAGARVRLAGERAHTNRRGRTAITTTFAEGKRYRARARHPAYHGDAVTITIPEATKVKR